MKLLLRALLTQPRALQLRPRSLRPGRTNRSNTPCNAVDSRQFESGGGNLTPAAVLRAKRDGVLGEIAGADAQCPYISNARAAPPPG